MTKRETKKFDKLGKKFDKLSVKFDLEHAAYKSCFAKSDIKRAKKHSDRMHKINKISLEIINKRGRLIGFNW